MVKSGGSSNEGGKDSEGKRAAWLQPNKQIKTDGACHNELPPLSRGLHDGRPHGNDTHRLRAIGESCFQEAGLSWLPSQNTTERTTMAP